MTIHTVISSLEHIVATAQQEGARYGYFASLYLGMTRSVRDALGKGLYENNVRMERLCVVFAQRYLDAHAHWRSGTAPSSSWSVAFSEGGRDSITIIQHLLLGVNAHINLDLGIAACEVAEGDMLSLKADFDSINDTIAALFNDVKAKLRSVSWPIRFLDDLGGNVDDSVANFSIRIARDEAWRFALSLNSSDDIGKGLLESARDASVARFANKIIYPGFVANLALKPIKWFEPKDVRRVLSILL
ncbi:MAG: DUF5995 family protein [Candidatus Kapabacteria bacterium]|nr:DUF5995 family protein [Candidatus Kapabacteria bacterium]